MHGHIRLDSQNPTYIFHKDLTNPQIFKNPQNLGKKCIKCMKRSEWEHIPRDWGLNKAESWVGRVIWVKEVWVKKERDLSRKKGENEI